MGAMGRTRRMTRSLVTRSLVTRSVRSVAPGSGARRSGAAVAVVAALAVTAAGCGSDFRGVYDLPLPGGADVGSHPYRVTAQFANVLNLVPQSAVKVNDVAVGRVTDISLPKNGWTANVTLLINGDVHLPANALAQLEQSSLLGEKYIQLAAPADGTAGGSLANGAVIPMSRTNRNPEIEEVFGALSLLLNGGGLQQLRTINRELNAALTGNEPQIRASLERISELVSNLDAHKTDIIDTLDGLNRLSATLEARRPQIAKALDDLSPGLTVLEQQRGALVTMLRTMERLSDVSVDIVNRSKDDMIADLRALVPILRQLAAAGSDLPKALQVLLTYPFTDAVLDAVKGDYLNVYLSVIAAPGTTIIPPISPDDAVGALSALLPPGAGTGQAPLPLPLPLPSVGGTPTSPTPGTSPSAPSSTVPGTPSAPGTPSNPGSPGSPGSSGGPSGPGTSAPPGTSSPGTSPTDSPSPATGSPTQPGGGS
jgi:phospholipid/cholesterol/gamma-HCH transport system substrate-binding protein